MPDTEVQEKLLVCVFTLQMFFWEDALVVILLSLFCSFIFSLFVFCMTLRRVEGLNLMCVLTEMVCRYLDLAGS